MLPAWCPYQPNTGLDLKPGVVIVLEFGSQRQVQSILNKHDLILQKCTEKIVVLAVRIKRRGEGITDVVGSETVAQPPYKLLPLTQQEPVLELDVKGITALINYSGIALSPVVVKLQYDIGIIRNGALPSTQQVAPGDLRTFVKGPGVWGGQGSH